MKGAVAAGDRLTAEAAVAILKSGGNAFDAAVAACFAAPIAEPALTSAGGGGFLLAVYPGNLLSFTTFSSMSLLQGSKSQTSIPFM